MRAMTAGMTKTAATSPDLPPLLCGGLTSASKRRICLSASRESKQNETQNNHGLVRGSPGTFGYIRILDQKGDTPAQTHHLVLHGKRHPDLFCHPDCYRIHAGAVLPTHTGGGQCQCRAHRDRSSHGLDHPICPQLVGVLYDRFRICASAKHLDHQILPQAPGTDLDERRVSAGYIPGVRIHRLSPSLGRIYLCPPPKWAPTSPGPSLWWASGSPSCCAEGRMLPETP